ncbi:MAG: FHA domain-containing protein [Proteobacteria bacterium]|nr:FHA domain-containing protein [Pseudomonadota bacterium]
MKYRINYQNTSIEAPNGEFLVGRSAECNLVFDDPSVSRIHAAIIYENGKLYAEDKGSRNGIKVNSVPAPGRTELGEGDEISVGHQRISIHAVQPVKEADKTVGLKACPSCGTWFPYEADTCPKCGTKEDGSSPRVDATMDGGPPPVLPYTKGDTIAVQQPIPIRASLALKAIHVSKLDEAERLIADAVDLALKKQHSGTVISDDDFNAIVDVIMKLANASKSPAQVSLLFSFHSVVGRLMTRDLVEELYQLVRAVGYRACPELSRYLSSLASRAQSFSPGEKFVFKRLEGLVKVCS